MIKPLVKVATRYIKDNQTHPTINAALTALYRLVNNPQRKRVKDLSPRSTVKDRIDRWLDRLADQGHHEVDMLATITAMFMHRELYPNDFKSGRNFNHQVVTRFLRMVRAPRRERWSEGKPIYIYDRITVGVRESLSTTLGTLVGPVCDGMGRLLTKSITEKDKQ